MLRDFFSIPIHPDNEDYRRELFKDTKIRRERPNLFVDYFCKYPVIFLSLKGYENCETWLMKAKFSKKLVELYEQHEYVYEKLAGRRKNNFDQICSDVPKDSVMEDALVDLSGYLRDYHRNKCIVLIDEYDHPLDIAYRYNYYEEARGFFASLFGALLKGNDENSEKALLVGVSRVAKSGYLSGLNNLIVFPMHNITSSDCFGFTESEVSILLQHNKKEGKSEDVRTWYDGYRAGNGIHLFNPWSINSYLAQGTLEPHWVGTGGTTTIKKCLWHSTEDFRKKTLTLLQKGAINVNILQDINYNTLSPHASDVLWTLLYYGGYLTMNEDKELCIPNTEVFTKWKGWLNNRISSNPDTMLEMLLQCNLTKFEEELPTMIMESLSYFDTTDNSTESDRLKIVSRRLEEVFRVQNEMLWESWEIFVANYDAFRTNLLIKREKKSARLSELYCGAYGTPSTLDIEVELKELSVCSAKEQFPCNKLTDKKSSESIDWVKGENVIVNGASASWGDAFVAREIVQNSNYKYNLSIHQCKYYRCGTYFTASELNGEHIKNLEGSIGTTGKLRKTLSKYQHITIVFTIQPFDDKVLTNNCLIITKNNFKGYFGPIFASRATFSMTRDINPNFSDCSWMENELPGVGKATAGKIVKARPYLSEDDFYNKFSQVKRSIEKYEEKNTGKKVKLDFYPFNVLNG